MTATESAAVDASSSATEKEAVAVAYLLGAGATQGAIAHAGGQLNQLMSGLAMPLTEQLKALIASKYADNRTFQRLVNELLEGAADFEQITTFFEESPVALSQQFGQDLKAIFADVLRSRLDEVDVEVAGNTPNLFGSLIDMHNVTRNPERLAGVLSLNYDVYLETAVDNALEMSIDNGLPSQIPTQGGVSVIKLHGSFGWSEDWPIQTSYDRSTSMWIPPGIRKPKGRYPFNLLWGRALDILDCDVLRIIGCQLSPNDWDLVSLLFARTFSHRDGRPFWIEIISWPEDAEAIRARFPYLKIRSLYQVPDIGEAILSEQTGDATPFAMRGIDEQMSAVEAFVSDNPFEYWLIQMANQLQVSFVDLSTRTNHFARFAETYAGSA